MSLPGKPLITLDHKAIYAALMDIVQRGVPASHEQARADSLPILRHEFDRARAQIREWFEGTNNVQAALHNLTHIVDQLIVILYQFAGKHLLKDEKAAKSKLAVIAVGGYGRCELFPHSDIDLLFLHEQRAESPAGKLSEFILYVLWDLGIKVGHAVRDAPDTLNKSKEDFTIVTALLDARLVCGEKKLFHALQQSLRAQVSEGSILAFVDAKLAERDRRHQRMGDSRYVLEPNVKEGKGGLRDLHNLYWMAKYTYGIEKLEDLIAHGVLLPQEYKAFAEAQEFFWRVRMHMHYRAGRAEERLTFDMQKEVASALGYPVAQDMMRALERFMKRYFLHAKIVGGLTRIVCANLEEDKKRKPRFSLAAMVNRRQRIDHFVIEGERLHIADEEAFSKDPALMLELFYAAQENELDIHPRALRAISRHLHLINRDLQKDKRANEMFMAIMLSSHNPEITLRRMHESGVLGRFIPDFGRVIGQMQYDMYHTYTVDEHTLFAIGLLHAIETGQFKHESPVATQSIHQIESRRVLYLALFCHDIAKGRGGDHSQVGEKVVLRLAARFGFTQHEKETVAWLVRHHLLMSHTAFKRDINDPQTVQDFVGKVQSLERLRLLLVLTVADIRAVGPHVWNGWKGALLRDLYYHAEEKMGAGESHVLAIQAEELKQEIFRLLPGWTLEEVEEYLALGTSAFHTMCSAGTHARIARMVREVSTMDMKLRMDKKTDTFRSTTEIALCTLDQPGLFSKAAGVMALAGANIVNCRIYTLKNGIAIEVFDVQDAEGKAFDKPDKLARLYVQMEMALAGRLDIDAELAKTRRFYTKRTDMFKVPAAVFIDNKVSSGHTVIEVGGRDRIGFLYSITKVLSTLALTISTAHVSTYGERAVDVFYVKDIFGMKIEHDHKLKQIREALMEALIPPAPADKKLAV